MTRWLAVGALLSVVGLLAGLLIVLLALVQQGVTLRIEGPIEIAGEPQTQDLHVTLELSEPLTLDLADVLDVRTHVQGIPCSTSEGGMLLPVRWNLLSGEIAWECVDWAGEEASPLP